MEEDRGGVVKRWREGSGMREKVKQKYKETQSTPAIGSCPKDKPKLQNILQTRLLLDNARNAHV